MFLIEGRPILEPAVCFLCEQAPDTEYVDTLRNFEPDFWTHIAGRKYVCRDCVEECARLIGWGDKKKLTEELKATKAELKELEDRIHAAFSEVV